MAFLHSTEFNNMEDLFWHEIDDLYDAEKRLVDALPKMADAAHAPELKTAFREHLGQTKQQLQRLEQIYNSLGKEKRGNTCEAMKGLISEGEEIVKAKGDAEVKDAALVGAAQRVEHYEIAGYGTARSFAQHLGHSEAATLLETTLAEEKETDQTLTRLAEESLNAKATNA